MTPEEMASDEMRKICEQLSREAFNDHQIALNSGTQSDLFQCGRCHKRNTTYNQVGNYTAQWLVIAVFWYFVHNVETQITEEICDFDFK